MTIRVLLADDQAMVRTGFRAIIQAQRDMEVVGEAGNGGEAVELSLRLRPDVVLMDVRMPVLDGIEATKRILADVPTARILVLTTFDNDEYVVQSLAAGATGFLLKDAEARALLGGIRSVHRDEPVLASAATRALVDQVRPAEPSSRRAEELLQSLSERERQVVTMVADGLNNREIAEQLFLAESTVKTHLNRILAKLNVRDRVGLVIFAYDVGLANSSR